VSASEKDGINMVDFQHRAGEKGQSALDRYAPVKIGFLGSEFSPEYRNIHQMAFDIAKEEGWLPRNVEMIAIDERGLPQGTAKNVTDGYMHLVNEGCIAVVGAYSSDNAIVLAPLAKEVKVPVLSWAGTDKLLNDWTFRLGNGDCGGDPALICHWLLRQGCKRPGIISEISPNGEEYLINFRRECLRWGLEIGGIQSAYQTTDNMEYHLERLRDIGCDGLVHMGYGMMFVHDLMVPALKAIDWAPPRITTTAFMFYLTGFSKFEGWVGIDQYCPDNPRAARFIEEYRARYKSDPPNWPNAIPLLAYDSAVVMAEAMFRAPTLNAEGMKIGMERIRFLPTATGGPRTHIAGAPGDHNLFKGDWLLYSKMEGGKLKYEGLFEPALG
jgi:ABC-type branched-subunit amino acid transport system substrate-binding protein